MAEVSRTAADIAEKLLNEVLEAWRDRNERNAAKEAKVLTFWRDGMLKQLGEIAEGSATRKTYDELKKNFAATAAPASKAMQELGRLRGKVADLRIADRIDRIVNDPAFGKNMIRHNIQDILANHPRKDVRNEAIEVCRMIDILNAELRALNRMVYGI